MRFRWPPSSAAYTLSLLSALDVQVGDGTGVMVIEAGAFIVLAVVVFEIRPGRCLRRRVPGLRGGPMTEAQGGAWPTGIRPGSMSPPVGDRLIVSARHYGLDNRLQATSGRRHPC